MTIQTRATLKGYFDTGDTITTTAMGDLIDSFAHLSDSTAQTLNSDLAMTNLIAANVSAGTGSIAGTLTASAATFTGRLRHGVSAAASAADSRGDFLVVQEGTATNTTAQVAFVPSTSNIAFVRVKVITDSSTAAGGMKIMVGNTGDRQFYGNLTVSAKGIYEVTNIPVISRITGASGSIQMFASGASANTNFLGVVGYYQRA